MTADQMTKTLTAQQWYAIINGLRHMGATYSQEHSGVNLDELADSLVADMVNEHSVVAGDFETGFRPTDEQISHAVKYANDFNLDSVFVMVRFPGKVRGTWTQGQRREAVFVTGSKTLALWVSRSAALDVLDLFGSGHAVFRVYGDGHVHIVDEA